MKLPVSGFQLDKRRKTHNNLFPVKLRVTQNRKPRLFGIQDFGFKSEFILSEKQFTKIIIISVFENPVAKETNL